jgi:hypothetical protein
MINLIKAIMKFKLYDDATDGFSLNALIMLIIILIYVLTE